MLQVSLRKMCILLDEAVYKRQFYLVIDGVEFTYVLTDFLPAGSVHFWEGGNEVSNYESEFIYFLSHLLQLYQFLPHIVWHYC